MDALKRENAELLKQIDLLRKETAKKRSEKNRLRYEEYWVRNGIRKPTLKPGAWVKKWRQRASSGKAEWRPKRRINVGMKNGETRRYGKGVYSDTPDARPQDMFFLCKGTIDGEESISTEE